MMFPFLNRTPLSLILLTLSIGCAHFGSQNDYPYQAKQLLRETIECQAAGQPQDQQLRCEPSGVAFSNDQVWLVNDKTIGAAPTSSILVSPFQGYKLHRDAQARPGNPVAITAKKWEDIDTTPDGEYLVATTGFDRVKPDGTWDVYSRLVSWPKDNYEQLSLVQPSSSRNNIKSHIELKSKISALLSMHGFESSEYFKIEGLTLTRDSILLGIREVGLNYEAFSYTVTIIQIPYKVVRAGLQLTGEPQLLKTLLLDESGWGLSSLTLGHEDNMLLVLVSKEAGDNLSDLNARLLVTNTAPLETTYHWVKTPNGKPLELFRKAEGITHLGSKRYLIIHDDDRRLGQGADGSRRDALEEASYDIIQFFQ